jgi:hypothetical protein
VENWPISQPEGALSTANMGGRGEDVETRKFQGLKMNGQDIIFDFPTLIWG